MKIDREKLILYFTGECSEAEKEEIGKWLEESSANMQFFINERIRFDASLLIDEKELPLHKNKIRKFIVLRNILKVAGVLLIILVSSYFIRIYLPIAPETSMQTVFVPAGNRTSITLPDGSLVWLNSNTTLSYPSTFTSKERIVELNGEAHFEVAKDIRKRFIVKTQSYNIEVLGTTFNVEAYNNKSNFSTALFTGKVKVYKNKLNKDTIFLNEGEKVTLINDQLVIGSIDANLYRWKDGLIIIEDLSFEEIMELFEKYYGQDIIIRNKQVKELGYRGKLRIADGVDHALYVLQRDFHFSYKRDEDLDRIYIY